MAKDKLRAQAHNTDVPAHDRRQRRTTDEEHTPTPPTFSSSLSYGLPQDVVASQPMNVAHPGCRNMTAEVRLYAASQQLQIGSTPEL